ncbi:MAG: hypothetical protein JXB03_02710 [Spirochaetales bacterium]|nr:hypothetical protein [Spirochaetales bacterium]
MNPEYSLSSLRRPLLLLVITLFLPVALSARPEVRVYRYPDPERFGRDKDRSATAYFGPRAFAASSYTETTTPFTVAVVIPAYVRDQLSQLSSNTGTIQGLSVQQEGNGVFRFSHASSRIHARFELIEVPSTLYDHIRLVYTNSFWQDMVTKTYKSSLIFKVYGGNDLDRDGVFSFREALAVATLLGSRDQPLLGIHDGSGYLENIAYPIRSNAFQADDPTGELIMSINDLGGDFVREMYDTITGSYRYEPSAPDKVQHPDDFLNGTSGDSQDFALAFYHILIRKGYEARILQVLIPGAEEETEYVTVFRKPETFVWSAVHLRMLALAVTESLEDIPALLFRQNLSYAQLDPEEMLRTQKIPAPVTLSQSVY